MKGFPGGKEKRFDLQKASLVVHERKEKERSRFGGFFAGTERKFGGQQEEEPFSTARRGLGLAIQKKTKSGPSIKFAVGTIRKKGGDLALRKRGRQGLTCRGKRREGVGDEGSS